jgi:DNA invertase Pin-like site-specific DNA recombinase
MTVRIKGWARVYLRRSTSAQESSLETQLQWAIDAARRYGIPLRASLDDLKYMQLHRLTCYKDIYLDDATSGSKTKRPAFDAMLAEFKGDSSISHLFVFKRDRFGRPKDPVDMMVIERDLRLMGVTLVMSDGVIDPSTTGQSALGQTAMSLFGYHESGEFSRKLSERIVLVQTQRAAEGYSTGGRPPYGFGRFLCDARTGEVIQELEDNVEVQKKGCHVRFLPNDERKIAIWIRILEWLEADWGYKRVANELNRLGIPSPDAGRTRRDNGIEHAVSGRWNHNTVKTLAGNAIITGVKIYGRYSEGVHYRVSRDGPRPVAHDELRPDGSGKVLENDRSIWIEASAGEFSHFDRDRWERLQQKLKERSGSQAGKRKASNPGAYPLAVRVFDLTDGCGSVMHGAVRRDRGSGRPIYRCGAYMKSQGESCHHNAVDAESLLQFALRTIVTTVKRAGGAEKLRAAIEARARAAHGQRQTPEEAVHAEIRGQVEKLRRQVEQAPRRILEAEDDDVRAMLHSALRDLRAELAEREKTLVEVAARLPMRPEQLDVEAEVQKALALLDQVQAICADPVAREELPRLFNDLGVRIGLTFREGRFNGRRVRKLKGGIIAFGNRPLPCVLRTSSGLPMPGGLAVDPDQPRGCGCGHGCHDDHPEEARCLPGKQNALPSGQGGSTGPSALSRGGTADSPVGSETPRRPREARRLSKVSRGDWIRTTAVSLGETRGPRLRRRRFRRTGRGPRPATGSAPPARDAEMAAAHGRGPARDCGDRHGRSRRQ